MTRCTICTALHIPWNVQNRGSLHTAHCLKAIVQNVHNHCPCQMCASVQGGLS